MPVTDNDPAGPPPRKEHLAPFRDLEEQARQLERSIFFLILLVAVAPPALFSVLQVRQLRARAAVHAGHVAGILSVYARMPGASEEGLKRHLRTEMEHDDLARIEVHDAAGRLVLEAGAPPSRLPTAAEMTLPREAAPFSVLRVRLDDRALVDNVLRLVAVHALVGLVLGLGVYRIPVTAFSRTLRELKCAHVQLVHSNRLSALGSMYAALTHEVNNPLGILTARAGLALAAAREKGLDEDVVRDLEVVDRQATRIAEIVRSLLAFSRKADLEMRTVDLNAVVRDVAGLVQRGFAAQSVVVRTELAPALPEVQGSPDHLQQVLLNLLTNARDAMPGGGTLTVRTVAADGEAVVEVRDTGPGLTPEVEERLFEPFFTTKAVGKGTGLGLSVSHGIVSAHGGHMEATNAPGGGALFRVALPALRARGAAA